MMKLSRLLLIIVGLSMSVVLGFVALVVMFFVLETFPRFQSHDTSDHFVANLNSSGNHILLLSVIVAAAIPLVIMIRTLMKK